MRTIVSLHELIDMDLSQLLINYAYYVNINPHLAAHFDWAIKYKKGTLDYVVC